MSTAKSLIRTIPSRNWMEFKKNKNFKKKKKKFNCSLRTVRLIFQASLVKDASQKTSILMKNLWKKLKVFKWKTHSFLLLCWLSGQRIAAYSDESQNVVGRPAIFQWIFHGTGLGLVQKRPNRTYINFFFLIFFAYKCQDPFSLYHPETYATWKSLGYLFVIFCVFYMDK